jgi:DNA-binding response OmpR family regulator
MDEYITKPIETTELLFILNKFLSDKAVGETAETVKAEEKVVEEAIETPEESITPTSEISEEAELTLEESASELFEMPKEAKILIAKKLLLTRKVLAKVLENLGHDYDILDDMDMLESRLASCEYDILFTDTDLVTESISQSNGNVAIISSSNTKVSQEVNVQKGETISNTASKEEIENIITKYRG